MAWLSTITADGTITESKKYVNEEVRIVFSSGKTWIRTRVVTVIRYVGLTQAAAESKASTASTSANVTDAHTEATGGGSYAAVVTTDVRGAWTQVTP